MSTDNLLERIRRVVPGALDGLTSFDANDARHIDHVAGHLLQHLRGTNDGQAFALLVELTQERLSTAARQIAREVGLVKDPDDLVAAFFSRLLTDLRRTQLEVRHFLQGSTDCLRAEAEAWVRDLACMDLPSPEVGASESAAHYAALVKTCFHRLATIHRQVLRAGDVEVLSVEEMARAFSLTTEEVRHLLSEARLELSRLVVESTGRRMVRGSSTPVGQTGSTKAFVIDCTRPTAKTLADILYEMAVAALVADTTYEHAHRRRLYVRREKMPELFRKAQLVGAELAVDLRFVSNMPNCTPRSDEAIDGALQCIECSEFFFGPSASTRFLRAQVAMTLGRLDHAYETSSALLADPHPRAWTPFVHGQRLAILFRQTRYEECIRAATLASDQYPHDCVIIYNLMSAQAEIGDRNGWSRTVGRLAPPRSGDRGYWARTVATDAEWMAEHLGITQLEVVRACSPLFT